MRTAYRGQVVGQMFADRAGPSTRLIGEYWMEHFRQQEEYNKPIHCKHQLKSDGTLRIFVVFCVFTHCPKTHYYWQAIYYNVYHGMVVAVASVLFHSWCIINYSWGWYSRYVIKLSANTPWVFILKRYVTRSKCDPGYWIWHLVPCVIFKH